MKSYRCAKSAYESKKKHDSITENFMYFFERKL